MVDILLGLQWGDEGKGKLVDCLVNNKHGYDVVARYQGGSNSGHTVVVDGHKHVFHILPSAMLVRGVTGVIGNGVVIDPVILVDEIEKVVAAIGYYPEIVISGRAHITIPTHRLIDLASEMSRSKSGSTIIGSTCRGNSPTYSDKINRTGIRMYDLLDQKGIKSKYVSLTHQHIDRFDLQFVMNRAVMSMYGLDLVNEDTRSIGNFSEYESSWWNAVMKLRDLDSHGLISICDVEYKMDGFIGADKKILIESAQGTMLDIDFGDYPYVTSSNTVAGAACAGLGVSPRHINDIIGVIKAYPTRIGSGFFPTEIKADGSKDSLAGDIMLNVGKEFGSTTGRPRRCGWFDAVAVRRAMMINGVTKLALMKSDVLVGIPHINICYQYKKDNGDYIDGYSDLNPVTPLYRISDGYNSVDGVDFDRYIQTMEEAVGMEIDWISLGAERNSIIKRI